MESAAIRRAPPLPGPDPARPDRAADRARRRGLGDHQRPDGRDGCRARDGSGRARVLHRRLGGDDGRDDVPVDRADGRDVRADPGGATERGQAGSLGDRAVRRRLPARLDGGRPGRLRDLPARQGGDRGRLLVGQRRPVSRRRDHPRRRRLPAHAAEGRLPAPLPKPVRLPDEALAARATGQPAHGSRSTAAGASAAAGR